MDKEIILEVSMSMWFLLIYFFHGYCHFHSEFLLFLPHLQMALLEILQDEIVSVQSLVVSVQSLVYM